MDGNAFSTGLRRVCARQAIVWLFASAAILGCGKDQTPRLVDYLEKLEFDAPTVETVEIALGDYRIPIAVKSSEGDDYQWRRLQFKLYAVAEKQYEKSFEAAWQRCQGQFHDEVLQICRSVTADELADPRLAGMKLQLTDMARSLLGKDGFHQVVMKDVNDELL